jgi:hypothetical protein
VAIVTEEYTKSNKMERFYAITSDLDLKKVARRDSFELETGSATTFASQSFENLMDRGASLPEDERHRKPDSLGR